MSTGKKKKREKNDIAKEEQSTWKKPGPDHSADEREPSNEPSQDSDISPEGAVAQPITPQTSSQGFHKNCRDESQNKETTLISHLNYDKRLDTSSGLHQQERQDQLHFNQYHKKKMDETTTRERCWSANHKLQRRAEMRIKRSTEISYKNLKEQFHRVLLTENNQCRGNSWKQWQ